VTRLADRALRLALRLTDALAPPHLRASLIGDLLEEVALRAVADPTWLLSQLLRSLPSLLLLRARAITGAQGVRDAPFLSQGAFVSLLPVIALLVGGQHVLPRGRPRLAAAVGAALLTAALAVGATQPSDNLAPGLLPALLVAIVASSLWRLLAGRATARAPLADA
jgi:hypothetical protein